MGGLTILESAGKIFMVALRIINTSIINSNLLVTFNLDDLWKPSLNHQ